MTAPALPPYGDPIAIVDGAPMIRVRGLAKRFGQLTVLDGFDMEVARGETFTVLGPSGSGKSTLLKQIVGLMKPDAGSIEVGGRDVVNGTGKELALARQSIGFAFQYSALLASLTVEENVALPLLEVRGMRMAEARPIVEHKLELVRLAGFGKYLPAQLSGGMRKRVGFARAIVHEPQVLLYDEPTTGLDPVICRQIDELIIDLREKLGVTSIVISHDVEGARRVSDRMGVLFKGRLAESGTPDEIMASTHPAVRQLLDGAPEGPLTDTGWRPE